mmetsp:Transcript_13994/g.26195  ORF Transcript_13994/g.26195 Transcript_13994/m.26195 type:complete len:342 (-) Transcript_13994:739-1764(-)
MTIFTKLRPVGQYHELFTRYRENLSSEQLALIDSLSSKFLEPESKLPCITNLSPNNFSIIGRDRELAEVKELLETHSSVAIVGLAGMGKTTLGKKLAEGYLKEYDIVWKLNASDDATLEESLKGLACELKVETSSKENYAMLLKALTAYQQVLFLFDNAEAKYLDDFQLFERNGRVKALYTSRNSIFPNPYILKGWTQEVALNFMDDDRIHHTQELTELVERLSCIPLALKLVKSFIEYEKMPVSEMLEKLGQDIGYFSSDEDNSQLIKIIKSSIDKAARRNPEAVMFLASILSPENVPVSLFDALMTSLQPVDLRRCFRTAQNYSLIERDVKKQLVSMHR